MLAVNNMAKKVHRPVIGCPLAFFHGGDAKLISHFVQFKGFTVVQTCVERVLDLNVAVSCINSTKINLI